jgi:outer membrane biosynthesis protein TonB
VIAAEALPGTRAPRPLVGLPLAISLAVHVALIALFYLARPGTLPPSPPIYRVDLVAAPPGERAAGVVRPEQAPPTAETPPVRPKTSPTDMPTPTATQSRAKTPEATPTLPSDTKTDTKAPTPTAGGGETGGRGTDVATVSTGGIEFPYPGYLENIVRQIAVLFHPPAGSRLKAEVMFLIRRDGTVSGLQFRQRSGSFTFDLEAQGAVEAASKKFGPLPAGFKDDVLPVMFSFDPRLIR